VVDVVNAVAAETRGIQYRDSLRNGRRRPAPPGAAPGRSHVARRDRDGRAGAHPLPTVRGGGAPGGRPFREPPLLLTPGSSGGGPRGGPSADRPRLPDRMVDGASTGGHGDERRVGSPPHTGGLGLQRGPVVTARVVRESTHMADKSSSPSDRHRHARRPAPRDRRRRALLAIAGALVAVTAAVLLLATWDGPDDAAADQPGAPAPAAASTSPAPASPPAPAPTTTAEQAPPAPDVPVEFTEAMRQIGIPLDPHTGWVVAQGICVRLGQPQYDQFRMSEGVERLFPSVPDEQAHAFVAMVAESVCHV
jgi:hypothetical protein